MRTQSILDKNKIKGYVCEYRFHPVRKFRFDFAFIEEKIAIELQGGIWSHGRHSRGGGMLTDMEKNNLAVTMGWKILFYSAQTLPSVIEDLKLLGVTNG